VFVDGRLLGAISYSLGSFPKEPLAGITPIGEMTAAVDSAATRPQAARSLALAWPATPTEVFAALSRLAVRAAAPLGGPPRDLRVVGPQTLADLAPALRPIGAAIVVNGFEPDVDRDLRQALAIGDARPGGGLPAVPADGGVALRPGDPIGMSMIRGDFEMGATGTVTYVDGSRVYAFGHPFLDLGPSAFTMTRAHVYTVLPSLESSMKVATLGPVIGTISQDRETAVGGLLGPGPKETEMHVSLAAEGLPTRQFTFFVVQDQILTPLLAYVAVQNSLASYERQNGVLSVAARGTVSFGKDGVVTIDDLFSGDTAAAMAAAAVSTPVGAAMANTFRTVMPERIDLELRTSERQEGTTIERIWLDTTRPRLGETYTLQVQLQDFRGGRRTIAVPVTLPAQADGPLTVFVGDAPSLVALEQHDLKPGHPTTWPEVLTDLNAARRNNRLYVRLISSSTGTVVDGDTLPALPTAVRSILDADTSVARAPVLRTAVGAWEQRLDVAVHGSREITIAPTARQ
jgi:hypothetical protein